MLRYDEDAKINFPGRRMHFRIQENNNEIEIQNSTKCMKHNFYPNIKYT